MRLPVGAADSSIASEPRSARWRSTEPYTYRSDSAVPPFADDRPVVVFDGDCALCSGFARFILKHDRRAALRLLPAQSVLGQSLYRHWGLDPLNFETNALLENGRAWFKSEGSIRIFVLLGFPWSMAAGLKIVPRPLLDRLYDAIARNRIRWFGIEPVCFLGDASHADRFLR